jgi:hypothetical protein
LWTSDVCRRRRAAKWRQRKFVSLQTATKFGVKRWILTLDFEMGLTGNKHVESMKHIHISVMRLRWRRAVSGTRADRFI